MAKNRTPTLLTLINTVDKGHAIDVSAEYHLVRVKGGAGSTAIEAMIAELAHIHPLGDTLTHDDLHTLGRKKSADVAY